MNRIYTLRILIWCILMVAFSASNNAQTFVPVNVTGFNHDLIANGSGGANRAEATTTITFDDPATGTTSDNVLYSKNFRGNSNPSTIPPFGLPDDGIITSLNLPGAVYHLASYDQNNALVLRTQGSSGTLTLETPGVFSKIAFLGASSNGNSSFDFVLNFSDGTSFSTTFTVPDWYSGSNYAIKSIGRVYRTTLGAHVADEFNGDAENPRLYDNQLTIDPPFNTKILTSITITKTTAAGSTGIFAINGITAINAPNAPVANVATDITINSFTANWTLTSNTTEYYLDVSSNPTFSTLLPGYNNLNVGNVQSLSVTGLSNGETYYYRVRAGNIAGISASSNTIEADLIKCPSGDLFFTTQAQVDQFIIDYPKCTEIQGAVLVQAPDATDLASLTNITKIGGNLDIWNCPALNKLTGLAKLTQLGGRLVVFGCGSLTNISPLANLTSINGIISLDGNVQLNDITGILNISPGSITELYIQNNLSLSVCDYSLVCDFLKTAKPRNIANNAGECITEQSVKDACNNTSLIDGEYCSNAIDINTLFGHPIGEPHASGTYSTEGMNNIIDPAFGHECFDDDLNTIWFKFVGDGNRYAVRSNDCSAAVYKNPNGAMYAGTCDTLTAIKCHRDIWTGDIDTDINFKIELNTEVGQTYYMMVEITTSNDLIQFLNYGEFCLEVTRLDEECLVTIPDANLKAYLIANADINKNGDAEIQCEEAKQFVGEINCADLNISNMTGIDAFISLSGLDFSNNHVSSINLNKNTILESLDCSGNSLTFLDITANTELWFLNCADNNISELDLVPQYRLQEFNCSGNSITALDLSKNEILFSLNCSANKLSYLNVANGNNSGISSIDAHNNADLTCIQVDDAAFSKDKWVGTAYMFDGQQEFNEYCEPPCKNAEDIKANFLFANSACVDENVRIIEYGIFTSIADSVIFKWDFGNGETSSERDPIVTYKSAGDFKVRLTLENIECPLEITKDIMVFYCLKQANEEKISSVFPNPSLGDILLNAKLDKPGDILVNIYTPDQKVVYSRMFTNVSELAEPILLNYKGMIVVEFIYAMGIEKHKVILLH